MKHPKDKIDEAKARIHTIQAEMAPAMREYSEKAQEILRLSAMVWEDAIRNQWPDATIHDLTPVTVISAQENPLHAADILSAKIPDGSSISDTRVTRVIFNPGNWTFSLFTDPTPTTV